MAKNYSVNRQDVYEDQMKTVKVSKVIIVRQVFICPNIYSNARL